MGTRADFYVGMGASAEWIGSIAFDGYPEGYPCDVIPAKSESDYRGRVKALLERVDHGTKPEDGWPWPWEDSRTTDYAYAWTPDGLAASCFGHRWFDPSKPEPDEDEERRVAEFPDMTARRRVARGKRSGLLVIGMGPSGLTVE